MAPFGRRRAWAVLFAFFVVFSLYSFRQLDADGPSLVSQQQQQQHSQVQGAPASDDAAGQQSGRWSRMQPRYPVRDMRPLPKGRPSALPRVQAELGPESPSEREVRLKRRDAVKHVFQRCWASYRKHAWMSDELTPVSGRNHNPFGGWGATLVDSLDTLWIMGLRNEFDEAVAAAATIDFDKVSSEVVNVFETNIRYLGGFLAAYDLSGDSRLLAKAREVGEMLYVAFDTPNRMPVTRWDARSAAAGKRQLAHEHVVLAELGSFSLEFIRLSLLTRDPKWYDAAQRVIEALRAQQHKTRLPGMWPTVVDARAQDFRHHTEYTLGALVDSLYEYLAKTHALVGGLLPVYRDMYEAAMDTAIRHNLYRPMLPDGKDVLVAGHVTSRDENGANVARLRPEGQHLVCFAGGLLALGGKLVGNDTHVAKGEKLTDGCIWTYQAMPLGIMPETFHMVPCEPPSDHHDADCPWDEEKWLRAALAHLGLDRDKMDKKQTLEALARMGLPKGFAAVNDPRYVLRPEAIESVFVLYRITGRRDLPEAAWRMFQAIENSTRTPLANSALVDVTVPDGKPAAMSDSMESFWLGETLKYLYLVFSEPELVSLDDYVFNTEAHPLKRLLP